MLTLLNGGKEVSSKVKFSKFFLILKGSKAAALNYQEIYLKFILAFEKSLSSQKVGLGAFKKPSIEGAFFNAFDNINEAFRVIEECINGLGVNTEQEQVVKIGVNADAQNWFVEDQSKYDWDGPKSLMDSDQLMDFYDKLLNEHPLLEYIEDPFGNSDVEGFKKYIERTKLNNPGLKIGVNQLFKSDLETIKEYTQFIQEESDEEDIALAQEGDSKLPAEDNAEN
mmetsp:Transcript_6812/g.11483  ORF Transcript_6812/g.11483 Transcript_6812/m.11483 type:complete len:225 (-) Transcript_6812:635-1309(-)